jgi:ribosomal protein S4
MKKKVLQRRYGGYLFDPLSENLIPHKNLGLKWKKRLQKRWGGRLLSSSLGIGLKNLYEKQKLFLPLQSSCSEGVTSGTPKGLERTLTPCTCPLKGLVIGVKGTVPPLGLGVGDAGNSNSLKGQRYQQSVWESPFNPPSPNPFLLPLTPITRTSLEVTKGVIKGVRASTSREGVPSPSKEEGNRSNSFPIKRLLEQYLNHPLTNWDQLSSEGVPMSGADSSPSMRGEEFFVGGGAYGRVGGKKEFFSSTGGRVEPFNPVLSAPLHLYGVHQFLFFQKKSSSDNPYRLLRNPFRGDPNLKLPLVTSPFWGTEVPPKGVNAISFNPLGGSPSPLYRTPVVTSSEVRVRVSSPVKGRGQRGEVTPFTPLKGRGAGEGRGLPRKGSEKVYLSSSLQIKGELTRLEGFKRSSLFKCQLRERKKLSIFYGNLSRRKLFEIFNRGKLFKGSHFENSLSLLERRADVALFRIGFFPTILSARQWIRHGRVVLNGQTLRVGSFLLSPGDFLSIPSRYHRFFMNFRGTGDSKERSFFPLLPLSFDGEATPLGEGGLQGASFLPKKGFHPLGKLPKNRVGGRKFFKNSSHKTGVTPQGVPRETHLQQRVPVITPHWFPFSLPLLSSNPNLPPLGGWSKEGLGVQGELKECVKGETSNPLGSKGKGGTLSFLLPSFRLGAPHRLLINELIRGFPFHLKRTGGESVNTRTQKDLHLHKGRESFTQRPSSNLFRGCENTPFAPLKLYRKLTLEGGFLATQNLAPHIQNLFRGYPSLGVRGTRVTPSFDPVTSKATRTRTSLEVTTGVRENGGKEGVTGLRIRSGWGGSTKTGTGAENLSSPKKYLGGGRWSYSSRPPFPPTLEFTPITPKGVTGVHPPLPSEGLTPLSITRVPPTVFKKRGGEEKETPRKGFPQPFFKKNSFRRGKSLSVRPIKPTHLEVSYTHLTVIYLYSPQKISFPALLDLETIERSFRCGI